jgi:hypothetical protein
MKKIKMNKNGNVNCPRDNDFVNVNKCRVCESCFGIIPFSHVNCKRGMKEDEYLAKK